VVGDRLDASVSQDISLSGEGLKTHRAAIAHIEAAEHTLTRVRLEAAAEVRHTWVATVVAHQSAVLTADAFALATRLVAATEAKRRVGEATDLDLRLARLEQAKAARDLIDAQAAEATALTALATLVQQPVAAEDLSRDPLDATPADTGLKGERSDILAARSLSDAANADLMRANAAAFSPISLGAFAEQDGDSLVAGPMLGLTLPLWHQNQAERHAASGEVAAMRANLASIEAHARAEIDATTTLRASADAVMGQLGPDLDADAITALQSIEAGFLAGEFDLSTTIFLRAEVIDGRIATLEAIGAQADARIDALLAHDDPALLGGAQ